MSQKAYMIKGLFNSNLTLCYPVDTLQMLFEAAEEKVSKLSHLFWLW